MNKIMQIIYIIKLGTSFLSIILPNNTVNCIGRYFIKFKMLILKYFFYYYKFSH